MRWLKRLLCGHEESAIRTSGRRVFTECLGCGKESPGIETGGHCYLPRPVVSFLASLSEKDLGTVLLWLAQKPKASVDLYVLIMKEFPEFAE